MHKRPELPNKNSMSTHVHTFTILQDNNSSLPTRSLYCCKTFKHVLRRSTINYMNHERDATTRRNAGKKVRALKCSNETLHVHSMQVLHNGIRTGLKFMPYKNHPDRLERPVAKAVPLCTAPSIQKNRLTRPAACQHQLRERLCRSQSKPHQAARRLP